MKDIQKRALGQFLASLLALGLIATAILLTGYAACLLILAIASMLGVYHG